MAFIPSRRKKHDTFRREELNLTSMMDMMTIILLFLLKTYSTTGLIVTPSKDLTLPYSMSDEAPKKDLSVSITRQNILVADQVLMSVDEVNPNSPIIEPLYQVLKKYADEAKENEIKYAIPFNHEVIIQGDQETPFDLLVKVLYTCGQTEFYKLRLLTYQEK
ncbi:MAG: biopolymer transporter ExbD [Calditrichaeota bacterium]|nr:biopolymer transporter ExbD [Calditrichota bacterium]